MVRERNRATIGWAVVLLVGVLVLTASYLPFMNPPQCPMGYTQAQVDASSCIIGANIGGALARLFGIGVVGLGGLGSVIAVVVQLAGTRR